MNEGGSDFIYWFLGIAAGIALIVWFIIWYVKRANQKYAQLWATLAPLVNGTSKSSKMTGTYEGYPVQAQLRAVSDGDNNTSYYFEVKLDANPRGSDWQITYGGEKFLGFGEKRWHAATKNDALKDRLAQTGAIALLERWDSYPTVTYKAKKGTFEYSEQVGGMFAFPPPERFKAQLDLLAHLARLNEQVNAA